MRISTSNPQAKEINQKRGPTVGNLDAGSKRSTFMKEKASSGNEKSALADMVTNAVANRGRGMEGFRDPTVEGLHADTNVGPKNNTTANGAKLPAKYKKPVSKG
tara:strand:- start:2651 stop:2962 length:312 start_codon:yes stop_codon:yes gene_type:complete